MKIPKASAKPREAPPRTISPPRDLLHDPEQLHDERSGIALLSRADLRIIQLICEGMGDKQIACLLRMRPSTVQSRIRLIFGKLGVADRFELVIYAYINALVQMPGAIPSERQPGMT